MSLKTLIPLDEDLRLQKNWTQKGNEVVENP